MRSYLLNTELNKYVSSDKNVNIFILIKLSIHKEVWMEITNNKFNIYTKEFTIIRSNKN